MPSRSHGDIAVFDQSVFRPLRIGALPISSASGADKLQLTGPSGSSTVQLALRGVEAHCALLPSLNIELPAMSLFSFTGANLESYSCVARAETTDRSIGSQTAEEALSFESDAIRLRQSFVTRPGALTYYWDVRGPSDRPVSLIGQHAAIEVCDLAASVQVVASKGRVSLLDVDGDIRASALDGGCITWAGQRGNVDLNADGEVLARFSVVRYEGVFRAVSNGRVRVLVPANFQSGVEVRVQGPMLCENRTDLRFKWLRNTATGVVLTFGEAPPSVVLESRLGAVLLETFDVELNA